MLPFLSSSASVLVSSPLVGFSVSASLITSQRWRGFYVTKQSGNVGSISSPSFFPKPPLSLSLFSLADSSLGKQCFLLLFHSMVPSASLSSYFIMFFSVDGNDSPRFRWDVKTFFQCSENIGGRGQNSKYVKIIAQTSRKESNLLINPSQNEIPGESMCYMKL